MERHPMPVLMTYCIFLLFVVGGAAEPDKSASAKVVGVEPATLLDSYGDPLPEMVTGRLGTNRWRQIVRRYPSTQPASSSPRHR